MWRNTLSHICCPRYIAWSLRLEYIAWANIGPLVKNQWKAYLDKSSKWNNRIYTMHDFIQRRLTTLINVYSHFEKGCQKKCTRQSRKVLWVVLSSLLFKEIWKNRMRGHGRMFASAKGKQQKWLDSYSVREQCIDHIPYYLSGLSRPRVSGQPFSNSCIIITRKSRSIDKIEAAHLCQLINAILSDKIYLN